MDKPKPSPEHYCAWCPGPPRHKYDVRQALHLLLEAPESSVWARRWSMCMLPIIVASSVGVVLDTVPLLDSQGLRELEVITVTIFTVELLLRLLACGNILAFIRHVPNICDFLSVLPFYVDRLSSGASNIAFLRILRLIRMVNVVALLGLGQLNSYMTTVSITLAESSPAFVTMAFVFIILMVLFSTLIFTFDRGSYDAVAQSYVRADGTGPYQDIPDAFYSAAITMETVGYGDFTPVSGLGKLICCLMALTGIITLALPITVISQVFDVARQQGPEPSPHAVDVACDELLQLEAAVRLQLQQVAELVRRYERAARLKGKDCYYTRVYELIQDPLLLELQQSREFFARYRSDGPLSLEAVGSKTESVTTESTASKETEEREEQAINNDNDD